MISADGEEGLGQVAEFLYLGQPIPVGTLFITGTLLASGTIKHLKWKHSSSSPTIIIHPTFTL
jgi:hypothetical protein